MTRIGIQGAKGSFSESAALQFVESHQISHFQLDYLISSENVLSAVENKQIDIGIFAIENARGGVVLESIEALAIHRCTIIDRFSILVHQNLIALPGLPIEAITEIHSHQQALRQCQDYLATHFEGLPLIEEDDTAHAAQRLQNGELPKTAAVIANKACATLYNLQLLRTDIQDLKNNLTLFLGVTHYEPNDKK